MKININETISNMYTENRELIKSTTTEMYILYPSEGKWLKNTLTGIIVKSYVALNTKDAIKNYIEIDEE